MLIFGLTAFTSSKDIEKCIQCGMDDVLHKPLKITKFKEMLNKFIRD
jgi:CheY-like chemotaxis protein